VWPDETKQVCEESMDSDVIKEKVRGRRKRSAYEGDDITISEGCTDLLEESTAKDSSEKGIEKGKGCSRKD